MVDFARTIAYFRFTMGRVGNKYRLRSVSVFLVVALLVFSMALPMPVLGSGCAITGGCLARAFAGAGHPNAGRHFAHPCCSSDWRASACDGDPSEQLAPATVVTNQRDLMQSPGQDRAGRVVTDFPPTSGPPLRPVQDFRLSIQTSPIYLKTLVLLC